ncbi:MAG: hypothetical protein SNJ61_05580, partial [Fimbriimonadaceae bacterium]
MTRAHPGVVRRLGQTVLPEDFGPNLGPVAGDVAGKNDPVEKKKALGRVRVQIEVRIEVDVVEKGGDRRA